MAYRIQNVGEELVMECGGRATVIGRNPLSKLMPWVVIHHDDFDEPYGHSENGAFSESGEASMWDIVGPYTEPAPARTELDELREQLATVTAERDAALVEAQSEKLRSGNLAADARLWEGVVNDVRLLLIDRDTGGAAMYGDNKVVMVNRNILLRERERS